MVEFAGPVTEAMSVEARFTLCNMIIEFGARSGLVAPDERGVRVARRVVRWRRGARISNGPSGSGGCCSAMTMRRSIAQGAQVARQRLRRLHLCQGRGSQRSRPRRLPIGSGQQQHHGQVPHPLRPRPQFRSRRLRKHQATPTRPEKISRSRVRPLQGSPLIRPTPATPPRRKTKLLSHQRQPQL